MHISVVRFLLCDCFSFSFVGLAKPMGQVGRDFTFQSSFSSLTCFSFFSFRIFLFGGSNIRVLEARGLAGLAGLARLARLAGVAGRRIGTSKSNTLDALERSAD